jgi:threonine dehydrogenase-like Zn-dependent dehydrogenase
MRHLVYVEPGKVEWQEVVDPAPPPGGVVVAPLAVARCDLDSSMAAFGLFPGPFPVGHEAVGEVVATAPDVARWAPGDRVVVPFQVSCGSCAPCQQHRFAACVPHKAKAGAAFGFGPAGGDHGGAMADLLAVPAADHLLVAAPDLPVEVLCTLADNVLDGYRAVAPALAARPGADVLVVGGLAPSVGLYAAASALALGAGSVRYADTDAERCQAAASLGAEPVAVEGAWPRRFDRAAITVDNTGDADGLACALRSTDDYGTCTSVAIYFDPGTTLPLLEMYTRGVTFHTSRADARALLPEVLDLVGAGRLDPTVVPTTVLPWDQAADAWLTPATKLVFTRAG